MSDVITALQYSLNADLVKLKSISQNMANQNVTAYKRNLVAADSFGALLNIENQRLPNPVVVQDFSQGALKQTNNPTDVAIDGKGFFEVSDGERTLLTRNGKLKLNEQGYLSLNTGQLLLGQSGPITLNSADFEITPDGKIIQEGVALDQLKLVDFERPSELGYFGNGLYENVRGLVGYEAKDSQVRQSYLEVSNVNVMDETVRLIELTRHYQMSHNVLKAYDSSIGAAISTLGEF